MNVICDYCGKPAQFVDSASVYHGHSYGMVYYCPDCQAWVGVHKGTDRPLGRLADAELRRWKKHTSGCLARWDSLRKRHISACLT